MDRDEIIHEEKYNMRKEEALGQKFEMWVVKNQIKLKYWTMMTFKIEKECLELKSLKIDVLLGRRYIKFIL